MTTPLITISGPPGCGTTTAANALAETYGLEHVSGGDIFRRVADERGLTLAELTTLAEEDDSIDRELDDRLEAIAKAHTSGERECAGAGLILESRLAGWLSDDVADLRVYLDAPAEVRVSRIGGRTETAAELVERERSEGQRYLDYYDIDVQNRSIYDVVLNTAPIGEHAMRSILFTAVEELGLSVSTIQ